jgi:hypothetical protein
MRYEIEEAFKRKVPRRNIFLKFGPLMDYKGKYTSFLILLFRHMKDHYKRKIYDPIEQERKRGGMLNVKIDDLIQRLTNIYGNKTDEELAKDTKLKDVWASQRVLLEKAKVQMQQDALELTMAKLFGPQLEMAMEETEVIEGKEEDGTDRLSEGICSPEENPPGSSAICPEHTGDKPASGTGEVDGEVGQEDKHPETGKPLGKKSSPGH